MSSSPVISLFSQAEVVKRTRGSQRPRKNPTRVPIFKYFCIISINISCIYNWISQIGVRESQGVGYPLKKDIHQRTFT